MANTLVNTVITVTHWVAGKLWRMKAVVEACEELMGRGAIERRGRRWYVVAK